MKYNKKDHYHQKAKDEGYRARSAYKLKEILKRYKQIWKKDAAMVLDLGCAPGAWTQVILEELSENVSVIGLDIVEMDGFQDNRFKFFQEDVYEWKPREGLKFDLILSDMAPKTSGIKMMDHLRSVALCERTIEIADSCLKRDGSLVFKIFEGSDLQGLVNSLRKKYSEVDRYRPNSTRQASKEIYVIGIKKHC